MYLKLLNEIYDHKELFYTLYNAKPDEYPEVNSILNNTKLDDIYLSSDMHFLRDYEQIDDIMIKAHNNVFKNNSKRVWINLGDIGCKEISAQKDLLYEKIRTLNKGKYNILVRGNHDIYEDQFYYDCGFNIIIMGGLKWRDIVFSHTPVPDKNLNNLINIHGHLHQYPINTLYKVKGTYDPKEFNFKNRYLVYTRQPPYNPISLYQTLSLLS